MSRGVAQVWLASALLHRRERVTSFGPALLPTIPLCLPLFLASSQGVVLSADSARESPREIEKLPMPRDSNFLVWGVALATGFETLPG